MIKILTVLMATILWSNFSYAYSLGEKEIKILKDSVINLCQNPNNSQIKINNSGNNKAVLFEDLVEIDFSGSVTFSKSEWAGIKPLLPSKATTIENAKCILSIMPLFIEKFSRKYEEETYDDM